MKKQYPTKSGWNRTLMTLYTPDPVDVDEAKNLFSGGKPEDYEFPVIEQQGRKVKVIYRKLPAAVERDDLAIMTELCRRANTPLLMPPAVIVIWQKEEHYFRLEAWHDNKKIASVRLNHFHVYTKVEEYIEEDLDRLAKDAWSYLYPPVANDA
jgi:hypothetical protein